MIKSENDDQISRQALKQEIMTEIKQDARRRKFINCLSCLLLEALVIFGLAVFVASLLARSGLVQVPFLTPWLYRPAQPERQVVPLAGYDAADILISEASKAKVDRLLGTFSIRLTESELTTIVKEGLDKFGGSLPLPLSSAQIAIETDVVELFAVSIQNGREVTVVAKVVPSVTEDGKLKLTPKELKIGSLSVPASANAMLAAVLAKVIGDALNSNIGGIGRLVDISLAKGVMTVQFVPDTPSR